MCALVPAQGDGDRLLGNWTVDGAQAPACALSAEQRARQRGDELCGRDHGGCRAERRNRHGDLAFDAGAGVRGGDRIAEAAARCQLGSRTYDNDVGAAELSPLGWQVYRHSKSGF
jgi:hypothetical protein